MGKTKKKINKKKAIKKSKSFKRNIERWKPWIEILNFYGAKVIIDSMCRTKELKRLIGAALSVAKWLPQNKSGRDASLCGICHAYNNDCDTCILGKDRNIYFGDSSASICDLIYKTWHLSEVEDKFKRKVSKEVLQVVMNVYKKTYKEYFSNG